MELKGMRERMTMGVKARLRAGKANTGQDCYGCRREGETIVTVEEEAQWVRRILDWYNQEMNRPKIRQRLLEGGAPQKGGTKPRQIEWGRAIIDGIFKGARDYAFGIKFQRRSGEAFEIPIPPIIEQATYQRYLQFREADKKYPVHNLKPNFC